MNMMKTIYLAGGCFWGTQHYLSQFDGVIDTEVGYANVTLVNPTYQQVYTDHTGHVECVRVVYDPELISLATLCRMFFSSIDPLLVNRQGEDFGTRYRTGVYWIEESDRFIIEKVFEEVQKKYDQTLAVEKSRLNCFYSAEEYHQKYLVKNPDGYCHLSKSLFKSADTYTRIIKELRGCSDEEKKIILPKFFKTGKGEYGEGDKFLGVIVPETRKVAMKYKDVSYDVIECLLESEWHEVRLCALLILVQKYRKVPGEVVQFYLTHMSGINNWDLVDLSAPYILGDYLVSSDDHDVLYHLAESSNMWEQRIAVVSTLMLIRNGLYSDTIALAHKLMDTSYDLMQKAIGWMLREVGKRDEHLLVEFLEKNRLKMPRTMLRYAIEKFEPQRRMHFMSK